MWGFLVAVLTLLFVPGPTNTLLATSGALTGFVRSSHLILAEALGYLSSVTLLTLLVAPLIDAHPALATVLRALCVAYLLFLAGRLWRLEPGAQDNVISFRALYLATLLNPKGAVFALVLAPASLVTGQTGYATLALLLCGCILLAGTCWVAGGALLRQGLGHAERGRLVRRAGSLALSVFALLLLASALPTLGA